MPVLQPTRSTVSAVTKASIFARDAPTVTVTVLAQNGNGNGGDTLSGGAIAGIVIGSVVGTLLLIWVIRSCFNLGASPQDRDFLYRDAPEPKRHHHSRRSRSRRYSHSSDLSTPPPVVVRTYSRSRQRQPSYVYQETRRGRSS